jgi:hypothetical protein
MKQHPEIEELLQDFAVVNAELTEIIVALRNIVLSSSSEVEEGMKYGGIVFLKHHTLLGGLFLRKTFVTLEFSFGNELIDDDNILEGSGKFRRNLKFRSLDDINTKRAQYFIRQALSKEVT